MPSDNEPTVTVHTMQYVVIKYGAQSIHMPASEAVDLIKPLSTLLPDDLKPQPE